jgi:hypothetical protein
MQELRRREHGRYLTQRELAAAVRRYRWRAAAYYWRYRLGMLERE